MIECYEDWRIVSHDTHRSVVRSYYFHLLRSIASVVRKMKSSMNAGCISETDIEYVDRDARCIHLICTSKLFGGDATRLAVSCQYPCRHEQSISKRVSRSVGDESAALKRLLRLGIRTHFSCHVYTIILQRRIVRFTLPPRAGLPPCPITLEFMNNG